MLLLQFIISGISILWQIPLLLVQQEGNIQCLREWKAIMDYIESIKNSFFEKYCLIFMFWFSWLIRDSFDNLWISISGWSITWGPQIGINMAKKSIHKK
jgi:hypothetical protein